MSDDRCPFCFASLERVFHAGDLVVGLWDAYPVSRGHALLIPRRHVSSWFDATDAERAELAAAIGVAREVIARRYNPDGFNIGVNVGTAAGQTVPHLHVHVIPRYTGDVPDPRGGIRRVMPPLVPYPVEPDPAPLVLESDGCWKSGQLVGVQPQGEVEDTPSGAAAFGEKILQLLDQGRRTSTYKYAVLLALTELCLERDLERDPNPAFATRELAEKVLELYWAQTADYAGLNGTRVLTQNTGGQAEIVTQIRKFRDRFTPDPTQPLSRVRHDARGRYDRLLRAIEWKLVEMPLPRLQLIGDCAVEFLYRLGWDTEKVRSSDLQTGTFDGRIYLQPGVADHLVRLAGLLRPLIQREWAAMVARLNADATDEARLQEFLFGAQRISLDPLRKPLRELQSNRCFYCERDLTGPLDVDHFIPWARYADNGIENLVVAHQGCNAAKSDHLAAADHVDHWSRRFLERDARLASQLGEIAERAGWDRHPHRTLNAARSIYRRLPADVRLWRRQREFVPIGDERVLIVRSLEISASPQ